MSDASTPDPLITVVMTASTEPLSWVSEALQSVRAQTYEKLDILVICEPVTSSEVLYHLEGAAKMDRRVRIHRNQNVMGYPHNLNHGTRLANGQFLARIDADDVWLPTKLEEQLGVLQQRPDIDIVVTNMLAMDETSEAYGLGWELSIPTSTVQYLRRTPLPHVTGLAQTSWWLRHPYDEEILRGQDRIFWLLAHRDSKMEILDAALYAYRIPRTFDLGKYLRSSSHTRAAIWNYGPPLVGRGWSLLVVVELHLKEMIQRLAYWTGMHRFIQRNRTRHATPEQIANFRGYLETLRENPVTQDDSSDKND